MSVDPKFKAWVASLAPRDLKLLEEAERIAIRLQTIKQDVDHALERHAFHADNAIACRQSAKRNMKSAAALTKKLERLTHKLPKRQK